VSRPSAALVVAEGVAPSGVAPSVSLARVPFRGGFILAAQVDGEVWVPLPPLCDAMGLQVHGQAAKLRAKPWATTQLICGVGADGKTREMVFLDLRSLPLWLATIEPGRVKPEAREALVTYQREAASVLAAHFLGAGAEVDASALVKLRDRVSAQGAELQKLRQRINRSVPRADVTALRYQLKHLEELQAFAIARNVTPSKAQPPPVELTERLVQKVWQCIQTAGWTRFTAGQVKVKDRGKRIGRANDTAAALAVLVARGLLTPTSAKHGRAYLVTSKANAAEVH
jgi:hypothetical protein